jgi:uncharacterized protein
VSKTLVIYHGNCLDGFTAAWATWKHFGEEAEYHPALYGSSPPDVTGRPVYIVDFSYKYDALVEMSFKARSIVILDHHKTAAEDLARLPSINGCYGDLPELESICGSHNMPTIGALFDMERSGAGIAWDFFHPGQARPILVNYVEDRDLWRFRFPATRQFNAYLSSLHFDFDAWECAYRDAGSAEGRGRIITQGAAILRAHDKQVRELVASCRYRMIIAGHNVPVANLPFPLVSDAGNLMAEGEPFSACYSDTPTGRVWSLRSKDYGMDVSEIAKQFGGGGHKHAAGFRTALGANP